MTMRNLTHLVLVVLMLSLLLNFRYSFINQSCVCGGCVTERERRGW